MPQVLKMALAIDHREKRLINFLQCLRPRVASLPVADVVCTYENGQSWAAERKTADELAKSIGSVHKDLNKQLLLNCISTVIVITVYELVIPRNYNKQKATYTL